MSQPLTEIEQLLLEKLNQQSESFSNELKSLEKLLGESEKHNSEFRRQQLKLVQHYDQRCSFLLERVETLQEELRESEKRTTSVLQTLSANVRKLNDWLKR